jgi:hypothetical protein
MPAALLPETDFSPPGMIDATAGQAAMAHALDIGVNAAQSASDIFSQHAAKQAELSGQIAGSKAGNQRDDKGNLLPLTHLPEDTSIYSTSFRDAALTSYSSSAVNDARLMAGELKRQSYGDSDKFLTLWNAYQTQALKGLHPLAMGTVLPHLTEIGNTAYGDIADQQAAATRAQGITGAETVLAGAVGDDQHKLMATGYNQGALDAVDDAIKTRYMPFWQQMKGIDKVGHGDGWIEAEERKTRQMLYTTMLTGEAQKIGSTMVRQADGSMGPDIAGWNKFVQTSLSDPKLTSWFKTEELQSALTHAASAFTGSNEANKQAIAQVNIAEQTKLNTDVGNLTQAANAALLKLKDMGTAALPDVQAIQTQIAKTRFAVSDADNAKAMVAFSTNFLKQQNDITNNAQEMEAGRLYTGSLNAPDGYDMKSQNASSQAIKTAVLRRQQDYDAKARVATGNPDVVLSATMDPAISQPLTQEFIHKTGMLPPRLESEFGMQLNNMQPAQANNVVSLYRNLEKKYPDIVWSLGEDTANNISAWEQADGNPTTYANIRATTGGKPAANVQQQAMADIQTKQQEDPKYTTQNLQLAIKSALENSSPLAKAWNSFLGWPDKANADIPPDSMKQGSFSIIMNAIPGMTTAMGTVAPGDLNLVMTDDSQKKFQTALMAASSRNPQDVSTRSGMALQSMDEQGYNISMLLMPPQSVDVSKPDGARNLMGTVVYGQNGPEKVYNANYWDLARVASIDIAQNFGHKGDQLDTPYKSAERGIWSLQQNEYPIGDPNHWTTEAARGRLRMEPVDGFDPAKPRYWLMGLVQSGDGLVWRKLNPDQPWTFDRSKLTQVATQSLEDARAAALSWRNLAPPGPAGQAGGAVVGSVAGAAAKTADEAQIQMQKHAAATGATSVSGLFDRAINAIWGH